MDCSICKTLCSGCKYKIFTGKYIKLMDEQFEDDEDKELDELDRMAKEIFENDKTL